LREAKRSAAHEDLLVLTRSRLSAKPRPGWDRAKQDVWKRSQGRCEVLLGGPAGHGRCVRDARDVHHVVPRSHFGAKHRDQADAPSNLAAVCRPCHERASAAYYLGRLRFERLTAKGWECAIVRKASKWSWSA
jgi:5-methylcytosine-specific restriction endonuclease McrA